MGENCAYRTEREARAALGRVFSYSITVEGWDPVFYVARTASKARAMAWRDYSEHVPCSFRDFLARTRVLHMGRPSKGAGDIILVCGEPALRISRAGEPPRYMRAGSDVIYSAHPMEVAPFQPVQVGSP